MKSDIEWIEELKEKAKNRELGINSINYYYSLKHLLELVCPDDLCQSRQPVKSAH